MWITRLFFLVLFSLATARRYDNYHLIEFEDVTEVYNMILPFVKERRVVEMSEPAPWSRLALAVAPDLVEHFTRDRPSHTYRVVTDNIQRWIDGVNTKNEEQRRKERALYGDVQLAAPERYLRYDEMVSWMRNITQNNSDKAQMETIGTSYEGRTMHAIKISTGSGRRKIFLDCGTHAREWIAPSTCIWIIGKLLNEYSTNPVARRMVDNFDWYIAPSVNPDGYEFSHGVDDEFDRLWRKNRRPTEEDPECFGADTNRNWDVDFGGEGTLPLPCVDTWPGDRAFSEPCTRDLSNYINANRNNMVMYVSMHSFTQLWLVPYAYDYDEYPPDYNDLMSVGNETARAIEAVNGRSFEVGTPPDILYAASGSSMDWVKIQGVKYSYSPELRPEDFDEGGFILDPVPHIRESGEEIFAGLARATEMI